MDVFLWLVGAFGALMGMMLLYSTYIQLKNPNAPQFRIVEITLASEKKCYTVEEWGNFGYDTSSRSREGFYGTYTDQAVCVSIERAQAYINRIEDE